MPGLFDHTALNAGVRPREVFAWSMYDFANSGYTTVVLTAVFNAYFVASVAGGAPWATTAWTATLSFSSLLVMLTAPAIGAWADARGAKKRLLLLLTAGCVITTAGLMLTGPGTVALAMLLVIASNYCYAMGEGLNAAFLPELAAPGALGKVSGWGWSFGYCGGMLTLGLSLAWVLHAQGAGQPASEFVPVTMGITAAVFALAAVPVFVYLEERTLRRDGRDLTPATGLVDKLAASLSRLRASWREARQFRDFYRLMWCVVSYQAGITVVIALAAIYADQVMGFTPADTMALIFAVNIAAALGAFGFGYLQDRVGHRRALAGTLLGWIIMVVLAAVSRSAGEFWIAAVLAGLCMGSSQSAGRAMAGLLAPAGRLGEFFGLWTFATRLAAVIGPITYGAVTWASAGNHRLAILVTGVFFVIGLAILYGIDIERGRQAALDHRAA